MRYGAVLQLFYSTVSGGISLACYSQSTVVTFYLNPSVKLMSGRHVQILINSINFQPKRPKKTETRSRITCLRSGSLFLCCTSKQHGNDSFELQSNYNKLRQKIIETQTQGEI